MIYHKIKSIQSEHVFRINVSVCISMKIRVTNFPRFAWDIFILPLEIMCLSKLRWLVTLIKITVLLTFEL